MDPKISVVVALLVGAMIAVFTLVIASRIPDTVELPPTSTSQPGN